MIKPVFDKSIVTPNSINLKISHEDIPWICGSIDKFYCNYYTDDLVSIDINFSIEDIGTCLLIQIYESTDYVNIMGLQDTKKYFQKMVIKDLENDFLVFQELLKKTRSYRDNSPIRNYEDVCELGYIYIYQGKILTGKSTIVINIFPDFEIKYRIWKTEKGWNNYYLEILEENDKEIRRMKEHIVKKYYKKRFRYGISN